MLHIFCTESHNVNVNVANGYNPWLGNGAWSVQDLPTTFSSYIYNLCTTAMLDTLPISKKLISTHQLFLQSLNMKFGRFLSTPPCRQEFVGRDNLVHEYSNEKSIFNRHQLSSMKLIPPKDPICNAFETPESAFIFLLLSTLYHYVHFFCHQPFTKYFVILMCSLLATPLDPISANHIINLHYQIATLLLMSIMLY